MSRTPNWSTGRVVFLALSACVVLPLISAAWLGARPGADEPSKDSRSKYLAVFTDVAQVEDFRMLNGAVVCLREYFQLAEPPTESDLLGIRDVLVPKYEDAILHPSGTQSVNG